ncbi:MAG TPA: hypothetical protein VMH89_15790, partial [Candidatus Acidoferrum sp.]|nr:hypothetical protein [Candidatus Acidoferrum sp.]
HGLSLEAASTNFVSISGTPDLAETQTFSLQVTDSSNQTAIQSYTITIKAIANVQLQEIGELGAGTIEILGVDAGPFNPSAWQQNTLNWVPDTRMPILAPRPGVWQNIYSPWPLEETNGWRLFYGGWDGTDTPNDRVYSGTTADFLTFDDNREMVIDHGAFQHVNNVNVRQLGDGSLHMICTVLQDPEGLDKPAYFSSPDGIKWNGSAAPYSAQLSDTVSIPNDPNYEGWDFNGGNVLQWDNNSWALYYSVGVYGGFGGVFRATSTTPPVFQKTEEVSNSIHYASDVHHFQVSEKSWYVMLLYIEEVIPGTVPPPTFYYSLSNDGLTFGPEKALFGGASTGDEFPVTPAMVTKDDRVLGVLYGANGSDLLSPTDSIFARWLQKKVVITDSSGTPIPTEGSYGPSRQRFPAPQSGSLQVTITVFAEDGITPLGQWQGTLNGGKVYQLTVSN